MMRVNGLGNALSDLQTFGRVTRQKVVQQTEATGRLIEYQAKLNAPVDTGKLRQSISYEATNGGLGARDTANVEYAPYIEFGTGGLVEIPDGFEELAGSYRGTGKRTINRAAHPFLIPAWLKYKEEYVEKIKRILSQ